MAETMDPTSSNVNQDDVDDGSITLLFSLNFNIAKCAVWWVLWLVALTYAFVRRKVISRAWFIYTMLLAVICFNGIQTSAYIGYALHTQQGHSQGVVSWLIYLLFFNLSRSAFLAVLMVVASGYCITRSDLGPHKSHVIFVPTTVLVTGLVTDFTFFALQSVPDADTYDLSTMGSVAAALWFVCSVLNLSALILAWMYIFEALGKETTALEEEYQKSTGKYQEDQVAAEAEAAASNAAAGLTTYTVVGTSTAAGSSVQQPVRDPEAGGDGETVADHLAYNAKKKLLSRFAVGVAAYLIADICVLLLPAFFNYIVQSTLQVLLFMCYLGFLIVLLVLFRPQEQSSYLMVGFSEEDAEKRGVNQLLTGIAMGELAGHPDDSDDEGYRPKPATALSAGPAGASGAGPSRGLPSAPAASTVRAAAKAVKKADKDAQRYGQLSSPPPLPVSSSDRMLAAPPQPLNPVAATADPGGRGPGGHSYGRQPRVYVPQPVSQAAGQFTLDDEDEGADDSSGLLAHGKGGRGKGG